MGQVYEQVYEMNKLWTSQVYEQVMNTSLWKNARSKYSPTTF